MPVCTKCGIDKPESSYYHHGGRRRSDCISCERKRSAIFKLEHRVETSTSTSRWRDRNPVKQWCISSLANHRRNGFENNITTLELLTFAKDKTICAICGRELDWRQNIKKRTVSNSPSLDRTDNELHLNTSNIQIVCYQCNSTKGSRTMREFIEYCHQVIKHNAGENKCHLE